MGSVWVTPADDEDIISGLVQYGNNRMYQYGTGAYYNENDYYLQNWQVGDSDCVYDYVMHYLDYVEVCLKSTSE